MEDIDHLPLWKQALAIPLLYIIMVVKIIIMIPIGITRICNLVIQDTATNKNQES